MQKILRLLAEELIDVADLHRAAAKFFRETAHQDERTRALYDVMLKSAERLEGIERRIVEGFILHV